MMRGRRILWAVVALAALAVLPAACFSLQQPPCAFTCVDPPHACPANYTCGADFLCHKNGSTVMCGVSPPDAGEMDAARGDADDDADNAAD